FLCIAFQALGNCLLSDSKANDLIDLDIDQGIPVNANDGKTAADEAHAEDRLDDLGAIVGPLAHLADEPAIELLPVALAESLDEFRELLAGDDANPGVVKDAGQQRSDGQRVRLRELELCGLHF